MAIIHVATTGTRSGQGTEASPVDLYSAMRGSTTNVSIVGGDEVAIHGGTYNVNCITWLSGSEGNPITIRPWNDEVVVIDTYVGENEQFWPSGSLSRYGFDVTGNHLIFEDLFFTNTDTRQRYSYSEIYGDWSDVAWRGGLQIQGNNVDVINCFFYDVLGGSIGSYRDGGTYYGNIMWYNGFDAPDRGHGHGMYLQNGTNSNPKVVDNNIVLKGMMFGMKAYGTSGAVNGFYIRNNTCFDAGQLSIPGEDKEGGTNIFCGGVDPAENCYVEDNTTYKSEIWHTMKARSLHLGWNDDHISVNCTGNYVVGGNHVITSEYVDNLVMTNNTAVVRTKYGESAWDSDCVLQIVGHNSSEISNSNIDNNNYFLGDFSRPIKLDNPNVGQITTDTWQTTYGQDQNSTFTVGLPTENFIKVEPNQYKTYRAHVTIYNWERLNTVQVDPSSFLNMGDEYYVYDTENMFGGAVATGTWNGGTIGVPMNLTEIAQPIYNELPQTQVHTDLEFGAYMVQDRPFNHPGAGDTPPPESDSPWFVSPNGSASGNGSAGDPWDLQTALNNPSLTTGDIIYLTAGIYDDNVTIDVDGNGTSRIRFLPYSTSPVLTGSVIITGDYLELNGITFTNQPQVSGDSVMFIGNTFNSGLYANEASRLSINQCTFNGTNDILRFDFPQHDRNGTQYSFGSNIYNINGQALFDGDNWSYYRMKFDGLDENSQFNYTP